MQTDHSFRNAIVSATLVGVFATAFTLFGWSQWEFDPALLVYAMAMIAALTLTVYRFSIWLHRPPTQMLYRRAIFDDTKFARRPLVTNALVRSRM